MANISVFFRPAAGSVSDGFFYHEFFVYTNDDGQSFYAAAGPSANAQFSFDSGFTGSGAGGPNYGTLVAKANLPYTAANQQNLLYSEDFAPAGTFHSELVANGTDQTLGTVWTNLCAFVNGITNQLIPYGAGGPNCNSVVTAALASVGLAGPTDNTLDGN